MKQLLATLCMVLTVGFGAGAAQKNAKIIELQSVLNKIQKASFVQMQTKRTVLSELMGTETVYEGTLSFSQKLFRWDHQLPEKSMILFDGKVFWSVQYTDKNDNKKMNISKSTQRNLIEKQNGISVFVGNSQVAKSFKVKKSTEEKGQVTLELESVTQNPQLQNLKVVYLKKDLALKSLEFLDEVGNLTKIDFLNTKFQSKAPTKFFSFKPPQGAQVTEL